MNDWLILAATSFVALVVLILSISLGRTHDREHPWLDPWFGGLHSGKGLCCDGSDAKRIDDADWESRDGHYRVRIEGEWVDVPDDAVVEGPNLAGRTMAWPIYRDGHPVVRCFIPGSMG